MRKLDDSFKLFEFVVDARLIEWGYWCRKILDGGLGYPSQSIESKLRADRAAGCIIPMNESAEEIDRLINDLGRKLSHNHALALRIRYVSYNNINEDLKKNNLKRGTYELKLREAKIWLSGKLDA
jgi:hypothetical protein